jgi:hypothetical protein
MGVVMSLLEPQGPQASPEARSELLVLVHAVQRRPAARARSFEQTLEALAYVERGRANGKVVITLG